MTGDRGADLGDLTERTEHRLDDRALRHEPSPGGAGQQWAALAAQPGSVFSFNLWADYQLYGKTFFDSLDYLTTNWLMPSAG